MEIWKNGNMKRWKKGKWKFKRMEIWKNWKFKKLFKIKRNRKNKEILINKNRE